MFRSIRGAQQCVSAPSSSETVLTLAEDGGTMTLYRLVRIVALVTFAQVAVRLDKLKNKGMNL